MENHGRPSYGCHPTASQPSSGDAGASSSLKMEEKPEGEPERGDGGGEAGGPARGSGARSRGDSRRRLRGRAPITALSR